MTILCSYDKVNFFSCFLKAVINWVVTSTSEGRKINVVENTHILIESYIHIFIQQIFCEYLLCADTILGLSG